MKILVVRRDNIGDLVLTTPVFAALRRAFPRARIEALVNSYNAPVLERHPDVDFVHVYTKSKHAGSRWDAVSEWTGRLRQAVALRTERFDHIVVASPGFHPRQVRLARWLRPRHIAAFVPPGACPQGVDLPVEYDGPGTRHHVEDTFRILSALGIHGPPPAPRLFTAPAAARRPARVVAVHISARKPRNRWDESRYPVAIRELHRRHGMRFRLFWAPGRDDDPRHPGDDDKARRVLRECADVPVEAVPTRALRDLVAAFSACDAVLCSDGGAMHIAAALGKPIVCLFGDSPAGLWHPWGVPYRLLQPATRHARDVAVDEVLRGFAELVGEAALEGVA